MELHKYTEYIINPTDPYHPLKAPYGN